MTAGRGTSIDAVDLESIPEDLWAEANRRFDIIGPLLGQANRGRHQVAEVAARAGVNTATIYRWLRTYEGSKTIDSLIPAARGPKPASVRVSAEVEAIITTMITKYYLHKQKHKASVVIQKVRQACELAGIKRPHDNTVRSRIAKIDIVEVHRARREKDEIRGYMPLRGRFPGADQPFATVQIDHTPLNIEVLDPETRRTLGRPWLTVAIDVFSRMVAGFYIGFEHPSAMSTGLCISQAILPKSDLLQELGIAGDWPVSGIPATILFDNAKEFRGLMLKRACQEYNITLKFRPVKTPHYGGHIERLCGTLNREIHALPGTTFEKPESRKGYDSSKEAALTLDDLQRWVATCIVTKYHFTEHEETKLAPIERWVYGMKAIGALRQPANPEALRIHFMPSIGRTIQRYGIELNKIRYYDEILKPYIKRIDQKTGEKPKYPIHYDPRCMSHVYIYMENTKGFHLIPYFDTRRPPISLQEIAAAKTYAKEHGYEVTENAIFLAHDRLTAIADRAVEQTKSARKQIARSKQARAIAAKPPISPTSLAPPAQPQPPPSTAEVIVPFEGEILFSHGDE